MKRTLALLWIGLMVLAAGRAGAYTPADCLGCHGENGTGSALRMDSRQLDLSVHGGAVTCVECHSGIVDDRHRDTPGAGTVDCTGCHDDVVNRHGLGGGGNRPDCHHCHTRHGIRGAGDPDATTAPARLTRTCRQCHPVQCGPADFFSFLPSVQVDTHKKQDFSLSHSRSNCTGCHQGKAAHGQTGPIGPDPCQRCHMTDAGTNRLMGAVHPSADADAQPGVFAAAVAYQAALAALTLGGFCWFIRRAGKPPGKDA